MNYRVYAIRYANLERTSSHNFLGGDDHDHRMPLDYFVWAIVGEDRTIIVDTGFDTAAARARGRELVRPVAEGLAAIGIDARGVSDVIITHMHYDHAGNLPLFAQARFHVQDAEIAYCTGRSMTHRHLAAPFDAKDVTSVVARVFDGRVIFHDGDAQIHPGITLHHLGGHTLGLQVVRVETARGAIVLASDAIHFWANLERQVPFPIVADVPAYLEALRTLRTLAPSDDHIIPGHDPMVLSRFPAEPGTTGIARLDLPPLSGAAS